jgi:TRAP-type C4-dicarboxylate transport system substrate-binding protein
MHKLLGVSVFALAAAVAASGAKAQERNFTLKFSYWVPPSHQLIVRTKDWGDSITKASNGTIKVTVFPSSQLGSGKDHYDMVKDGIAEIGLINPGYTPGRFPVIGATDQPFLITDALKAAPALHRWYAKYKDREMKEVMTCHVFTHEPGSFHARKKIFTPDDVKGYKIRTANQTIAEYVTLMGGTSVQVPIMEAFETLQRGMTDGITMPPGGLITMRFGELVKYHLDAPLYVSTFTNNINKRVYDQMSANQRKVIDDHCTPQWSRGINEFWSKEEHDLLVKLREDKGREFYKITDAQLAQWRKAAEPLFVAWKEQARKAGYNPDEIWSELQAQLKSADALY